MRIEEGLKKFLTQLEADGRSPHTRKQYRRHIRLLARWARDAGPRCDRLERLGHEDVAAFLASPVANTRPDGRPKKAAATNCLRSSVRGFFSYVHHAGYISQDPARLVRRAVCAPPPPRALSDEEERRLLSTLRKARRPQDRRDAMLFSLMLGTGVRLGSALGIHAEDVDLTRGEVHLRTTKGERPDTVLLGREVSKLLRPSLRTHPAGPLFTISARHAQRRFSQWLRRAGVTTRASPHCLRHSFAVRVYAKTGDILVTKEALRHRSIASTLVYARADNRRLREALGISLAGAVRA